MPIRTVLWLIGFSLCLPGWSQFFPSSASTRIYIGHFVDGGPAAQKWNTTLILTNPNAGMPATVKVSFYNDSGQPLPLDFGQGASAVLNLTLPAGGAKLLTSLGASSTPVAGWAIVETPDAPGATPPVLATPVTASVLYRAALDNNRWWDVAALGTGSTHFFHSHANGSLGVALANPNPATRINLQLTARNEDGTTPAAHGRSVSRRWATRHLISTMRRSASPPVSPGT